MLDELDSTILRILQENGRISNAELAQRVSLSPPATHARVRRLVEQGYIRSYVALLDKEKLGYDMTCFIQRQPATAPARKGWRSSAPVCAIFPKCWNVTTSPASSTSCSRSWCATARTWSAS